MTNAVSIQGTPPPKWLSGEKLEDLRKRGAHVLVPAQYQSQVSSYWQGVYEVVQLSPNPDDKDIWKLPGGRDNAKYGLSKTGLMKIARAAGIELYKSVQEERAPGYIRYEATVRKRDASGAWSYSSAKKSLDRANILEDETATQKGKIGSKYGPKDEAAAIAKADEGVRRSWKFHEERCETGAYLRALRSVLSIRGDYTQHELTKPFIVCAVHFAPDESQPELRQMMANAAKLTAVQLWDNSPQARQDVEERTGLSVAQLEAQRTHVQQLRDAAENEPPGEDDAFEAAMRSAIPAEVNLIAPHESPLDDEEI
jgi:hypothetical protein